ncbi:MAG: hypothetical protein IT443_05705 [Phycisphaeraceae bacterium]|nr:hypothetical protein [Phycisphaeraceae bacterium]
MMYPIRRIASLPTPQDFRSYVRERVIDLELDDQIITGRGSPLLQPVTVCGKTLTNRLCVHAMEGWDGTPTGGSTEPMLRRWRKFGRSGAKLIWGGEAMAVVPEGRANPNQLILNEANLGDIARLRAALGEEHRAHFGNSDDMLVGFQLTHSGRFCRPRGVLEPLVAFRHPLLDPKFKVTSDAQVISDDQVKRLIDAYIAAAVLARRAGADFVDVKHCHGYLLHEFLGAHTRRGPYGGSFENRTRILREIVAGIRAQAPGLHVGVRLSAFDFVPFKPDPQRTTGGTLGPGIPEDYQRCLPYRYSFGNRPEQPLEIDLSEPVKFLELGASLGIELVNLSAGSPYYNPHIQRPALFPPSDGYAPPEDPLVGVARQISVARQLKQACPGVRLVGSAYSYLQDYLPHVAQHCLRTEGIDFVGIGRMVLSYPSILLDVATGRDIDRKKICRTFSDCTTAPRHGLPSGCYPLDDYYKHSQDMVTLRNLKKK